MSAQRKRKSKTKKTKSTTLKLFPGWVKIWNKDPKLKTKVLKTQKLLDQRSSYNTGLPYLSVNPHLARAIQDFNRLLKGTKLTRLDQSEFLAQQKNLSVLKEFIEQSNWGRWVYLEKTLESASKHGDLLLGLLTLRTMCEEITSMKSIESMLLKVLMVQSPISDSDIKQMMTLLILLDQRVMPKENYEQTLLNENINVFNLEENQELRLMFQRLNDYIHPNYGSHLMVLFPEQNRSADVVLDSIELIYTHFLSSSWVNLVHQHPPKTIFLKYPFTWSQECLNLKNSTLPIIKAHRKKRKIDSPDTQVAPNLALWVEYASLLQNTEEDFEPKVYSGLSQLLRAQDTVESLILAIKRNQNLGLPRRPNDCHKLLHARQSAIQIEAEFPDEHTVTNDPEKWLTYIERVIRLAYMTNHYKTMLLIQSAIREINHFNPLGSILCMRSIVEHQAAGVWLGKRLYKKWDAIKKRAHRGSIDAKLAGELENDLAKFLAGTKSTAEPLLTWKSRWDEMKMSSALSLPTIVKQGLAHDLNLSWLYNYGSDVLHGRAMRGHEVLPPHDMGFIRASISRVVYLIDSLLSFEARLDTFAITNNMQMQLNTLMDLLDQSKNDHSVILKNSMLPQGKLKLNRDYTGTGTKEDPFVFINDLSYPQSFKQLCQQLSLDPSKRYPAYHGENRVLDVVPDSEREYCFLHTIANPNAVMQSFLTALS